MKCERYWREGVLLVEQGLPDPHRETCLDCRREHEARAELVRAFALVGGDQPGDPQWQARVWRRIAREAAPRPRRWVWVGAPVATVTTAVALLVVLRVGGAPAPVPTVAVERSIELGEEVAVVRSAEAATLGRWILAKALASDQVWFYRRGKLEYECSAAVAARAGGPGSAGATARCVRDGGALRADYQIHKPGEHHVLIIGDPDLRSGGTFDADHAAAVSRDAARDSKRYDVE